MKTQTTFVHSMIFTSTGREVSIRHKGLVPVRYRSNGSMIPVKLTAQQLDILAEFDAGHADDRDDDLNQCTRNPSGLAAIQFLFEHGLLRGATRANRRCLVTFLGQVSLQNAIDKLNKSSK